jgi:hypothetical protein
VSEGNNNSVKQWGERGLHTVEFAEHRCGSAANTTVTPL